MDLKQKKLAYLSGDEEPSEVTAQQISSKDRKLSYLEDASDEGSWVKAPERSIGEQIKNAPLTLARDLGATLHSSISEFSEIYRGLAGKLQSLGEETAAKEGREISEEEKQTTSKVVNALPDFIKSIREKYPKVAPTFKEAQEMWGDFLSELTGHNIPEEPSGAIERASSGLGKVLPFIKGGSKWVKGATLGTEAATAALDLPEGQKLAANLTVPALISIIQAVKNKKYIPSNAEAKHLMDEGHRLGLSDEKLAPILATEGQVARHGRLASEVSGTRKAFHETGEALGNLIEDLPKQAGAQVALNPQVQNVLVQELQAIENGIRHGTHALAPKDEALANFIRDSIKDIQNNGSSPAKLIGTWRQVNKIASGKTKLRQILDPITKALEHTSPQIAKDLKATNALYSRYIRNLKEINPSAFNAFVDAGELQHLLGAVFSGDAKVAGRGILKAASVQAVKRISSRILTDPRAQSLVRNFSKAVKDGRQVSARLVGSQLKEYLHKNLPEEYKDIDWEELGIKS